MGLPAAVARHPALQTLLRDAGAAPRPVYLFTGEPTETGPAAHALIEVLVPAGRRAFNLETYDGRTTPMATVLDSLRTPPFSAGTKVVWLRESPALLAGAKRADLTATVLAAWADGRQREAMDALLTLLALAGWSRDALRETRWATAPKSRVRDVFGEEPTAEQRTQLDAVTAACLSSGLDVREYQDESGALLAFLEGGMPPQTVLLLTAAAVDGRRRLVKQLHEIGAAIDLGAARERSGALSRESVEDIARRVTAAFRVQLGEEARQLILQRAGADTALLTAELEKLCLYAGEGARVSGEDVRAVFRDLAESWIFDFTAALAAGQLRRALPLLRGLFAQGEPPLRLLAMIARELRMLLLARECLDGALRGTWRADTSFAAFQSRVLGAIDAETRAAFGAAHPFVIYRRLQDAARLDARAVRTALVRLADLDLQLKSTRSDPTILLEAFVIDWCVTRRAAAGAAPARVAR